MKTLIAILILSTGVLLHQASATTYFVCTATGAPCNASDANAGTLKTATLLHPPGSSNYTGAITLVSGDRVIFRGGDTWFLQASGTPALGTFSVATANEYAGVDLTWFAGGSFARPIFSGNNALSTAFVGSCTHAESGSMVSLSANNVTFDNIEMTGVCWTGQASQNGAFIDIAGASITGWTVSNFYCHGWTVTSGASDNFPCVQAFGAGNVNDGGVIDSDVFDGSDSPHFAIGDTTHCQWSGNNAVSCYSGQGLNGSHFQTVRKSVFRFLSNAVVTANWLSYHDNLFEFVGHTFASGTLQQHPNVMNDIGCATGLDQYWYNNTMRHTFMEENIFFGVCNNAYFFGNVMYDNMNSDFGPLPSACIRWNTLSNSAASVNAFIYNDTDGDLTCTHKFEVANAPLTAWSGTGTFENYHEAGSASNCTGLCTTNLSAIFTCNTGGTCTITNNGTNVFQTSATSTAQGYTASNLYQPTTGGSTIHAGTNASASCTTFSPDSALCSGTSAGVSEASGSGGQIASYPAVTINPRGTTWDAGAYQFTAAAPGVTPAPALGMFAELQ